MDDRPHILVVDLNNFARYPTIAIGYLAAILRRAQMRVEVFSPLACGVSGVAREPRPRPWGRIDQWIRYRSATSTNTLVKKARARWAAVNEPALLRESSALVARFAATVEHERPSAVLISTYLMYFQVCRELASVCSKAGIPVLIGGPYFSQGEVAGPWIDIQGVAGVVGGEVEPYLPDLVRTLVARGDLSRFAGVWTKDPFGHARGTPAPPLRDLDALPFSDYSDFPWERYPNRIIPLITGRGCGWGACDFCSDVTSSAGRTFRSRSSDNVLAEIEFQSRRHDTSLLAFTDLKLNSNTDLWSALLGGIRKQAPNARWIAALHVDAAGGERLRSEMRAARAAGMVRLTTGLESGSQRILDRMRKGTDLSMSSRFLHDADDAGISVRTTMMLGYPGEEAEDVLASADFVERHGDCIERVVINRFQIMTGTRMHRSLERQPDPKLTRVVADPVRAQVQHHYLPAEDRTYRRAAARLFTAAHRINRRPLRHAAREFEGVM